MAITFTYHGNRPLEKTHQVDVLPGQLSDAVAVADDAVSTAMAAEGLVRIVASTACTVRIGPSLANANGGESWAAGDKEVRWVEAGDIIAVDAAA